MSASNTQSDKTPSGGLTRLFVTCAVGAAVVLLAACGLLVAVAVWPALIRPAPAPTMRPLEVVSATAAASATPAATQTLAPSAPPAATQPPAPTATPEPPTPTAPAPAAAGAFNPEDYVLAQIVDGLQEPVFLTHAGDGSGRLFIVEQPGVIRIFQAGALLPEPFLDIAERVNDSSNEQGLLGLAFHPLYAENGQFFVNYTDVNGDTVVARFTVGADPNRADPASEAVLLQVDQPYPNHNGGDLAFGPDGYLYIGLGDGGSAGDPQNNAQNPLSLLGKLLRVDVNTQPGDAPYALPATNPFILRSDVRPEIWALGLRNPWRFSFDRATGDLYIGDVGQGSLEEINFQPAASPGGENYGWRFYEGSQPYKDADAAPPVLGATDERGPGLVAPVAEYTHAEGGCSVTGGYVYRGAALPALQGVYLFADYCTGRIWSLTRAGAWTRQDFGEAAFQVSSFGEDEAGEIYVLNHRGGAVYQLVAKP